MKYIGMPAGMWMIFRGPFRKALIDDLGCDLSDAKRVSGAAKLKYREIIEKLPEFEKEDRFKTNMKEYGFYDMVPAMCHLDYTMIQEEAIIIY